MVERVSNHNNLTVQQRFAQMPEVQKGNARVVNNGENLWTIAKSELGENAKNSEINDYMWQIAKVNGLDSEKKMNNLMTNTKLYMPKKNTQEQSTKVTTTPKQTVKKPVVTTQSKTQQQKFKPVSYSSLEFHPKKIKPQAVKPQAVKPQATKPQAAKPQAAKPQATKPQATKPQAAKPQATKPQAVKPQATKPLTAKPKQMLTVQQRVKTTPAQKTTSAESSFNKVLKTIFTDKNIQVKEAYISLLNKNEKLYHVETRHDYKNHTSFSYPVMSFTLKNGQITEVSFDDTVDNNPDGYDYKVTRNNKKASDIRTNKYEAMQGKKVGTIPPESMQKLENKLLTLMKK